MKKCNLVRYLVLLIMLFILPLFSCTLPTNENENPVIEPSTPVTLSAPLNVSVDETDTYFLISYNNVENCSFYKIIVRNSSGTIVKTEKLGSSSLSYAIKKAVFSEADTYKVSVVAIGDGKQYFDSEESVAISFVVDDGGNEENPPIELMDYYKNAANLTGSALKSSLRTIITSTHTKITSYDECKKYLQNADEDPKNANNMLLFYTGESIVKSADMNVWNREHVWAQSLGWFKTSGAGADLHHIRPCNPGVNSSRGNKKFGTSSGYYTPKDDYKGDVARIIFYLMVRYAQADSYSFTSIAQSLDVLLAWNELDPVSVHEQNRNEYIAKIQGNRNPFIDYPVFAEMIWK